MRRILHASDFSPASAPAFARAVALAKEAHADLSLLHVLDPSMPMVDGAVSPPTHAALQDAAGLARCPVLTVGEPSGRTRGRGERRRR